MLMLMRMLFVVVKNIHLVEDLESYVSLYTKLPVVTDVLVTHFELPLLLNSEKLLSNYESTARLQQRI